MEPCPDHAPAWAPVLVAAAAFLAFMPALGNGWVNWDDGVFLLDNPAFRGFGPGHLRWMFTSTLNGPYQPLPWLTYAADFSLWGLAPAGYHLTSLLFHAANATLAFFLARKVLGLCRPPDSPRARAALDLAAAFAALAFALHPLRVESVAWASERRDVVCGAFALGALLAYLRAREQGRASALAVALFAAALLSKATAVFLPVVLLVMDVYPLRRLAGDPRTWARPAARRVWLEKAPYLLLALAMGLVAVWAQAESHSLQRISQHGLAARLGQAAYGACFYVAKTLFPFGLSPHYALTTGLGARDPAPWLAAAGVVLSSVLAWRLRRQSPALLAVWLVYLAALAPVLGLLQAGTQLVADRYSYLAVLGWGMLAAAWLRPRLESSLRAGALLAVAALLVFWGALTWRQTLVWRNSATLWEHALGLDPRDAVANLNMGLALADAGRTDLAVEHFSRALAAEPACVAAEDELLRAAAAGEPAADAARLNAVMEANPVCRKARGNLVTARAALGDLDGAIAYFQGVLRLQPQDRAARVNLERALRLREAGRGRPARTGRAGARPPASGSAR